MLTLTGPATGNLRAGAAVFVNEKLAEGIGVQPGYVPQDETEAVTEYGPPVVPFAEGSADVAAPAAFVTAVVALPAKIALAPLTGAANCKRMPLTP